MPKLRLLLRGITLPMLRLLAGPFVQRNAPSVSWGVSFCLPRFKLTHYLGTEIRVHEGSPTYRSLSSRCGGAAHADQIASKARPGRCRPNNESQESPAVAGVFSWALLDLNQ